MDKTQENSAVINNTDEVQTSDSISPVEQETPVEEVETQEVATQEDQSESTDYQDMSDSLPDEESEQARAFQKMRLEKKKLEDELRQLKTGLTERKTRQSSFEQLKASSSDVDQAVDTRLDEIRARELFPQLDPNSQSFDPDFEEEVASVYFFNLYQGKQAKVSDIAKRISEKRGLPKADIKKVEAEVTQKVKAGITQKEQASLSAAGRSQPGFSTAQEHESLVKRSRTGDNWAIAERLKRTR